MPLRVKTPVCSATSCGVPTRTRPPTPAYSPSEFSRTHTMSMSAGAAVRERGGEAGQQPHRPQVDVLIEPLTDAEQQVGGDSIRHGRRADRAEIDRVERREPSHAVLVHHALVLHDSIRSPTGSSVKSSVTLLPGCRASRPRARRCPPE